MKINAAGEQLSELQRTVEAQRKQLDQAMEANTKNVRKEQSLMDDIATFAARENQFRRALVVKDAEIARLHWQIQAEQLWPNDATEEENGLRRKPEPGIIMKLRNELKWKKQSAEIEDLHKDIAQAKETNKRLARDLVRSEVERRNLQECVDSIQPEGQPTRSS